MNTRDRKLIELYGGFSTGTLNYKVYESVWEKFMGSAEYAQFLADNPVEQPKSDEERNMWGEVSRYVDQQVEIKRNEWRDKIQKQIDEINCMDAGKHYDYQSALVVLNQLLDDTK